MIGSDLIFNIASFTLTILAIWLSVYFALQQQRADQNRKYEEIVAQLREVSKEISDIKSQVTVVEKTTSTHFQQVLDTQQKVILNYTTIENVKLPNIHASTHPLT